MSTQIDTSPTSEKITVMQAYQEGYKIEFRFIGAIGDTWEITHFPTWRWGEFEYRIKEEKFPNPPEGEEWHNPENLTPEQVGISKRYRLALKSGIFVGNKRGGFDVWTIAKDWAGGISPNISVFTYRTKCPLPSKPKLVPFEAGDIPAVCWVRQLIFPNDTALVVGTSKEGVEICTLPKRKIELATWEYLFRTSQYSTDRKQWKACSKVSK